MSTPWHEHQSVQQLNGQIIDVAGQPVFVSDSTFGQRREYLLDPFGSLPPVLTLYHYNNPQARPVSEWVLAIEYLPPTMTDYVAIPDSLTTLEERIAWSISYAALTS